MKQPMSGSVIEQSDGIFGALKRMFRICRLDMWEIFRRLHDRMCGYGQRLFRSSSASCAAEIRASRFVSPKTNDSASLSELVVSS